MQYYEKLKNIRIDRDINQSEIAEILSCKQSAVSKYECGKREMKISDIQKLCSFYKISADYILDLPKGFDYPER